MRLLSRYIFREIFAASILGGVLFTFILFLQQIGPVMELLVRATVDARGVGEILLLNIPRSLPYTIPMGVLVGVLVGLARLSTDGEIIAMRAAGISARRLTLPIAVFCLFGAVVCGALTLRVSPRSASRFQEISDAMRVSVATAQIQPRVFIEREFPDKVLYVMDVKPGSVVRWEGLFLADTSAPEERGSVSGINAAVDGPRITIAEEAVVVPIPEQQRLQVHLPHAVTFEQSHDPRQYQVYEFEVADQVIETAPDSLAGRTKPFEQMSTSELRRMAGGGEDRVQAGIVLHQRYALPIACLVLPMVGIPLSISNQRAGRSVGVVLSVVLAFGYWMLMFAGTALAEQRVLPPLVAVWIANAVFAALGAWMLIQLDSPRRRDYLASFGGRLRRWTSKFRSANDTGQMPAFSDARLKKRRAGDRGFDALFPIIDRYILKKFLFYFAVLLTTFVSIWFVFSFFELLSDMLQRGKLGLFVPYIYYLTPFLVYETGPLAVMAATLVCFGLLAKHQELIAFRATGVSLYRLALPVLLAALACGGGLFALDHFYLPETNNRQDAIRHEIKGGPVRTFLRPDRQWTFGQDDRIFYHRYLDYGRAEIAGLNVYDFRPRPFQLTRHIAAERARWDPEQDAWVFHKGWVRLFDGRRVTAFEQFDEKAFPDIRERPDYFRKEEKRHHQMNWRELRAYIADLTQAGFETVALRVSLHRKFAFPLFAFALALLALPFAMLTGARGALSPAAFSLGLAVGYYALNALFDQLGRAHQLTPALAAWAPALIFAFGGGYLLLRVRS